MTDPRRIRLFIDGAHVDSGSARQFALHDPARGIDVGTVEEASDADVDAAVGAARRALVGPWGRMPLEERLRALERVAAGIEARFDAFVAAEVLDTGKPVSFARAVDIPRGAANFRFFASLMRGASTGAYETATSDGLGAVNYVLRRPVGVVGVICPWNLPLLLMTWKVAPALAVGNTVVVKPSEETPRTASLLADVMNEAGIPPGVYNVVHGFGPGSAGEALTRHAGVDAITFTGESQTGEAIMKAAAVGVRPVSFELGGKNPALVFADCDLDEAVAGTLRSVFSNCGQVCLCSERVYVQQPIYNEFTSRLAAGARALRLGDPMDEATQMGPLISAGQRAKVLGYFDLARAEGADFLSGGGPGAPGGEFCGGHFVEPTIVTGLSERSRFIREEIFGPVCHVTPFRSEEEAVALANDTRYGLCAAVWTTNLARAHRVAAGIDAGIVWINSWFLRDLRTPFGGVRLSGLGREGGVHSLDFYSELKTICVKL